ncbi:unnamed protein product [Closterium sp. Naga37s-1]|nr:unnamed protein product [Closterium sp. Naga37s-1]
MEGTSEKKHWAKAAAEESLPFDPFDSFDSESFDLNAKEPEPAALAARPAHPAALHALYWTHAFNCFGEQSWRFARAAMLSLLFRSLLPVAVASFVSRLVVFAACPAIGGLMDSAPRVAAALIFGWLIAAWGPLVCAKACLALVALSLPAMLTLPSACELTAPCLHVFMTSLSLSLPPFLSPSLLPTSHSPHPLLAPLTPPPLVPPFPSHSHTHTSAVGAPAEGMGSPDGMGILVAGVAASAVVDAVGWLKRVVEAMGKGFRSYVKQLVMPASMAYVLLCLNGVLTPGGLMTSYLTLHGRQCGADLSSAVGLPLASHLLVDLVRAAFSAPRPAAALPPHHSESATIEELLTAVSPIMLYLSRHFLSW